MTSDAIPLELFMKKQTTVEFWSERLVANYGFSLELVTLTLVEPSEAKPNPFFRVEPDFGH